MSYEYEIQTVEAVPTVSIRRVVPMEQIAQAMGEIYGRLAAFTAEHGVQPAGPPYSRYHAITEAGFDLEAGFPLTAAAAGEGYIVAGELPGGRAAVYTHTGSYHKLGDAHAAGAAWVKEQGAEESGGPWEYYISDPGGTPENELQTRIFRPLKD